MDDGENDAAAAAYYAVTLENAILTVAGAFHRGDDTFARLMLDILEGRILADIAAMEAEGMAVH